AQEEDELSQMREEISTLKQNERQLTVARAEKKSHYDVIKSLVEKNEGIDPGTKYILKHKGSEGFESVKGIVADLLEVDVTYAAAVDAVLGSLSGAVVVSTMQDAFRIASALKENNAGQAAIISLDSYQMLKQDSKYNQLILPLEGLCSSDFEDKYLISAIRFVHEYTGLFESLMGRFQLVDSIYSNRLDGYYVTINGEVLSNKVIRTGSTSNNHGLVYRKSELTALAVELENLEKQIDALRKEICVKENEDLQLLAQCKVTNQEIEILKKTAVSNQGEKAHLEAVFNAAKSQLSSNKLEIEEVLTLVEKGVDRYVKTQDELILVSKECDNVESELQSNLETLQQYRLEKERIMEDLSVVNAELAKKKQVQQMLADSLTAKQREIEEREARVESINLDISKTIKEQTEAAGQIETERKEIAAFVKRISELSEEVSLSENIRESMSQDLDSKKVEQHGIHEKLNPAREVLNQCLITTATAEADLNGVVEYAARELSIDLSEHINDELPNDIDLVKLDEEVMGLKRKMGALGNVNLDALNELEEVTANLEHITTQEKDLVEAKDKLSSVMKKIDDKCRSRLLEVFENIRRNFYEIFRRLFGGGRADIILEEGKDILEAGIEIVAKPPGKDLISITLLSGGEKAMTTIALLFAIFRTNPSPFCILDEIDAPLDDSNTEKFVSLVQEFLDSSQFLIITHSQQTMQGADILYGITMQEPGVSTRISYSPKEAEDYVKGEKELLIGAEVSN
ncbi:MAG: hypothetical protein ABIH42_05740, partial [Planctomycetota bacterium]